MNRLLQIVNLLGIVALAALCGVQWMVNRAANLRAVDLEHVRIAQSEKITEQQTMIGNEESDLEEFRQRLKLAESQIDDLHKQLVASETERARLVAAVQARDAELVKAIAAIKTLIAERDEAIAKFNDLVGKYNALVKEAGGSK
jgi:septal ring factor EnvC (AmiA/AmiB activator)